MAAGEEGEQDVVEVGVAASSIGESGDKKEVTRKRDMRLVVEKKCG